MTACVLAKRLTDWIVIVLFLSILILPMVTWILSKDAKFSVNEKRPLNPMPSLTLIKDASITRFARDFNNYFGDHFGLREWLIHRYHREVGKRFHVSSLPQVLEGKSGWLFFADPSMIRDARGYLRFSRQKEQAFWTIFSNKTTWLRKRGMGYLLLIAPNKVSIYPEFAPEYLNRHGAKNRLDHLFTSPYQSEFPRPIDVRQQLLKMKKQNRLYSKSDTHWNYLGAMYAFQILDQACRKLFPQLPTPTFTFLKQWQPELGGDLAVMLGRAEDFPETKPVLNRKGFSWRLRPIPAKLKTLLKLPQLQPLYTVNPKGKLRVLILRDSFFNHLQPFVSETFAEALYIWQYYDSETLQFFNQEHLSNLLEIYQPDLVIEEVVERSLANYLPANSWLQQLPIQKKPVSHNTHISGTIRDNTFPVDNKSSRRVEERHGSKE